MRVVIIGAGPAGVTVAETLRQHDRQSEIVMLTDEPYPPYSPPAMVEYFGTGREVHFWRGQDFPERMGVDYRPGEKKWNEGCVLPLTWNRVRTIDRTGGTFLHT